MNRLESLSGTYICLHNDVLGQTSCLTKHILKCYARTFLELSIRDVQSFSRLMNGSPFCFIDSVL